MADPATPLRMSADEYLAWEREQPEKHEFHGGEVFLMAGGSRRHNFLAVAIGAELRSALRGGSCRVLSSDQRIAAPAGERYVYADCVVACGTSTHEDEGDVLASPSIIVEVLSKSTERYDRGDKWEAYQELPSLTDYLLVAQRTVRVEHYRRDREEGVWRYRQLGAGDTVVLTSGARIAVDAVYEVAFELPSD